MNVNNRSIASYKNWKLALGVEFHVIFWLVMQAYYFYSMYLFGVPFEHSLQSKLFYFPFQFIAAYFMLFVLLGKYLYVGQYVKAILGFILFIFIFSYMASFFNTYIINPSLNAEFVSPNPVSIILGIENLIFDYMRVIFLTPLVLICLEFGVSQFQKMKEVEDLVIQKNKTELDLLKTQIHPNFLISTLRNLENLTRINDSDGPVVIERLSETLDYILYKGRQEKIELDKEIEAVAEYIALENIRLKGTTEIFLKVENLDRSKTISPLLLFSFLEFNFKGYNKETIPFVKIEISLSGRENTLFCLIKNEKLMERSFVRDVYEIEKMKRQLEISYPDRYKMGMEDSEKYHQISLEIEL